MPSHISKIDPSGIYLSENGTVTFQNKEILRSINQEGLNAPNLVSDNYGSCTNGGSCGNSANLNCTNTGSCDGSSNLGQCN